MINAGNCLWAAALSKGRRVPQLPAAAFQRCPPCGIYHGRADVSKWPLGSVANADANGRFLQDPVLRWEPPRNLVGLQAALGIRGLCASGQGWTSGERVPSLLHRETAELAIGAGAPRSVECDSGMSVAVWKTPMAAFYSNW